MVWRIEFDEVAARTLRKLHPTIVTRILRFLNDRLALEADPRRLGEMLTGARYKSLWKYRVGDYRLIARIDETRIVISVVEIGHRSSVYR
jgi:mRNA interferase RelE/StbE